MTTKSPCPWLLRTRILAALAALATGSLLTLRAQSGTAATDDVLKLSEFQVSTTADKGYRAGNSVSATRVDTAIKDLPFSISAFTQQFIQDINSRDLFDVARYAPGLTSAGREFNAGNSVYVIRGFNQAPQHDGFTETNAYIDSVAIERVEVVKGPASLLYGQVTPGGTVNYITKKAGARPFASVNLQVGDYDFYRGTVDVNQPLIPHVLLFRVNAAGENGLQYITPSKSRTSVIDPTVTWIIAPQLSFTVNYSWFQRRETPPAVLLPNIGIATPASIIAALDPTKGFPSPAAALSNASKVQNTFSSAIDSSDPGFLGFYPLSRKFNYDSSHDYRKSDFETLNGELDAKFSEHWNARANYNYSFNRDAQKQTGIGNVYVAPPSSLTYNPATGTYVTSASWAALTAAQQTQAYQDFAAQILASPSAALAAQPAILPRRPRLQETFGHSINVQAEAAGKYAFNGMNLKPLVGVYYLSGYGNNRIRQNTGSAASPYFRAWDLAPGSPTYYFDQNTDFDIGNLTSLNTYTISHSEDQAAYGVLSADFFDGRLQTVVGARYTRSETQATNYITGIAGTGYRTHRTTPQAGLGYKILPDVLVYGSYSQSYTLPGQSFLRTLGVPNGFPAKATTGEGYELGVKTDLFGGRVSSTVAVYQIEQKDRVVTVNSILNGATVSSDFQGTKDRSRGVEYELTWSPLDNWQTYFSIAEDDVRVVSVAPGYEYYLGSHPEATAKTLANLWTRYTIAQGFAKGVWFGGGFNYVGRSAQRLNNRDLYLPGYTLWNAVAGYDFKWDAHAFTAALNWNNFTNKQYFPANQQRGFPSRVVFSLTARY